MELFWEKGYFGYYDKVFVQTVYLIRRIDKAIINYFTIITAIENQNGLTEGKHQFGNLNEQYSFGLYQRFESREWLDRLVQSLDSQNRFIDNGNEIIIDRLVQMGKQFVSTGLEKTPHRLITTKINSYLFEYFNATKSTISDIITNKTLVRKINDNLLPFSIDLSQNDERIGNILIEFPNGLIKDLERAGSIDLKIIWDTRFSDKQSIKYILHNNTASQNDISISNLTNDLIIFNERKYHQKVNLISVQSNLFILENHNCKGQALEIGVSLILGERRFYDGTPDLQIGKPPGISLAGDPMNPIDIIIQKSIQERELYQNEKYLVHRQYGVIDTHRPKRERHSEAIRDLHTLIGKYGGRGFCIWDPYLSAHDLIEVVTKIHAKTSLVKALGSKKVYELSNPEPNGTESTRQSRWFKTQREILQSNSDNFGLNLEFRCAHSSSSASFHDRFLIFPNTGYLNEVKVWSLGISINQFGVEHHVLHQVGFPNFILNAFNLIWDQLTEEKYLVFKNEYVT